MAHLRHCTTCNGSGYVYESSVKVKDIPTFLAMVAEAFIPFAGKKVRCWHCRGRGYYTPVKANYR